jgi:hypothetical protein
MLKKPSPQQTELEMATLEQLVPGDHLLRKVDAAIARFWRPASPAPRPGKP